jgi:hypothetical protein
LNSYILGHHNWAEISSDANVMNRGLIMSQVVVSAENPCAIEEFDDHNADQHEDTDQEQPHEGDESCEALSSKPPSFPRHRRKAVAPLDTSLLRRSAHLEKINQGFNPIGATWLPSLVLSYSCSSQRSEGEGTCIRWAGLHWAQHSA